MNKETDEKLKNMSIVKLILRLVILCFSVWDLYLIFKPFFIMQRPVLQQTKWNMGLQQLA